MRADFEHLTCMSGDCEMVRLVDLLSGCRPESRRSDAALERTDDPTEEMRLNSSSCSSAQIVCADTRLLTTIAFTANAVQIRAAKATSAHGQ